MIPMIVYIVGNISSTTEDQGIMQYILNLVG